jgi:hypothetical protein
LNPRRGCPLTRFRGLRTTVHRRPSVSVTCPNTTTATTSEPWRTEANETKTEPRPHPGPERRCGGRVVDGVAQHAWSQADVGSVCELSLSLAETSVPSWTASWHAGRNKPAGGDDHQLGHSLTDAVCSIEVILGLPAWSASGVTTT